MNAAIALQQAARELEGLQRQIERSELYMAAMLLNGSAEYAYYVTQEFKQALNNGDISIQRVLRLDNVNEVALSIRDGNDWRVLSKDECEAYKIPIE